MKADIIELALNEIGNEEFAGDRDNPEVMKYYHEIGHEWVAHDEVAWCAAVVNWVLMKCGYEYTGMLNARSFLEIGEVTDSPEIGDIAVFWRISPDSAYGHVAFFLRELSGYVYVLGGNQSNQMSVSKYPVARLLSYRKLKKIT